MSENKKHISNEDFQRYLKNQMTDSERNAFEREMQKHPFEAEALEGMQQFEAEEIQNDLNKLHTQISQKNKKRNTRFWAAAATFLLLISAGIIWFQLKEQSPVPEMAKTEDAVPKQEDAVLKNQPGEKDLTESTSGNNKAVEEEFASDAEVEKSLAAKEPKQRQQEEEPPEETVEDQVDIPASEIQPKPAKNIASNNTNQPKESEILADTELKKGEPKNEQQIRVRGINSLAASSRKKENFTPLTKTDSAFTTHKIVRGKVISLVDSLPLPGAGIIEKGTSNGTVSDLEGNFTLQLTDKNDSAFVASFIGMEDSEFYATGDSTVIVGLEPSQVAIDEVVVVGYGSQEKGTLTGSVSRIDSVPASTKAQPKSGLSDFKEFIKENAVLPGNYSENRVVVRAGIKIDPQGKIISVENNNDADYGWFEKAKELILNGPEWNPATINGIPVESEVSIRIVFKKQNINE